MNFVGGTLFFDGSMRIRENQRVDEWDGWQDWRIGEIVMRYMEFNAYYVDIDIAAVFWTASLRQKSTIPLYFTLKTGVQAH